jgi:O-antigen/teichoic acid export membrane protein
MALISVSLSRGLRNASYLALGNIASEFISLFGFVFIGRWLGPSNYGVYVIVTNFVGMFQLATLGWYTKVLVREGSKDRSELRHILEQTFGAKMMLSLLAVLLCIGGVALSPYDARTKHYIVLISMTIVTHEVTSFLSVIYQVEQRMQYITLFNVANRILFVVLSLAALYAGLGLEAVFVITLGVNVCTVMLNYLESRHFVDFKPRLRWQIDRTMLKAAVTFSLFSILTMLSTRFDVLIISWLGNTAEVGTYAVAYKIVMQGIMLRNINQDAFFPQAVRRFREGQVSRRKLLMASLAFLGTVVAASALLAPFCTPLIVLCFGEKFRASGEILSTLVFFLASAWATLPMTIAAQATHNEKAMLKIRSLMAVFNIVLDYLFYKWFGLIGIAYCTLVVWGVGSFFMCLIPYRLMKQQGYLR